MSTSLDRLVALVGRTGLPTVVSSEEGGEPCVLLPLAVYERLTAGVPLTDLAKASAEPPSVRDFLVAISPAEPTPTPTLSLHAFSLPPTPKSLPVEETKVEGLHLNDLFQPPTQTPSSISPRSGVLSDEFVFDGKEMKILPHFTQKTANIGFGLDGFEQTLA